MVSRPCFNLDPGYPGGNPDDRDFFSSLHYFLIIPLNIFLKFVEISCTIEVDTAGGDIGAITLTCRRSETFAFQYIISYF